MKGEFGFDIREAHGGTLFDNEGENEIVSVNKNCLEKKRNEMVMACHQPVLLSNLTIFLLNKLSFLFYFYCYSC